MNTSTIPLQGDEDGSEDEDEEYDENEGFEPLNLLRNIGTSSRTKEGAVSDEEEEEEEEGGSDDGEDNGDFEGVDDYVESDEDADRGNIPMTAKNIPNDGSKKESRNSEEKEISVTDPSGHSLAGASTSIKSPPNFSTVDTSLPLDELAKQYPLYYEALTNSRNGMKEGSQAPSVISDSSCSNGVKTVRNGDKSISSNAGKVDSAITGLLEGGVEKSDDTGNAIKRHREAVEGHLDSPQLTHNSMNNNSTINSHSTSSGIDSSGSDQPRSYQVTLTAGQMLFIPAGWFHEVRSTGGGRSGHLALNYWFHPPDGIDFNKPYLSDFWPNDWRKRDRKSVV